MRESSIEKAFRSARAAGRCAFIPYITGGFPDLSTCENILAALAESGADLIEVGLPFSDPLADGPTIQWASKKALDNGATPDSVFDIIARTATRVNCPLVLMTYYNPILKMGPSEFARRARQSGTAGVIVPDLPPEEAGEWMVAALDHGLETIFLVAPTTPVRRIEWITSLSTGFVYYVSMTGVTGAQLIISDDTLEDLRRVRSLSRLPLAVGFGISTPQQARTLASASDGVIVGSALIREISAQENPAAQIGAASKLAAALSGALTLADPAVC
jgi:tryptophan synthase alpha chain